MTKSEKEVLLSLRNEIVRELERVTEHFTTGTVHEKRRRDYQDYEVALTKIHQRIKTGEFSPEVIREQIEEAKRNFKV